MANNVKGIYRFLDTKTDETFEGTFNEYAEHLGVALPTVKGYLRTRRVTKERVGEIKIKPKPIIRQYFNSTTKQSFEGTKQEALKFFGLKEWKFLKMQKEGEILSKRVVDENDFEKNKKKSEKSEREKIRRKLYRKECLLKALYG